MNIKPFFLLGMIFISSGMCKEFLLHNAFGNNNGRVNASNNRSGVAAQLTNIPGTANNQRLTQDQRQRLLSQFIRQTMQRITDTPIASMDPLETSEFITHAMVGYLEAINRWIDSQQSHH